MAISFSEAKKYPKKNGFPSAAKIKTPLPSTMYYYSLSQGDDILLKPMVAEGDNVTVGQKLADLDRFEALPIFSSVSGRVLSVLNNTVTIENNMLSEKRRFEKPQKSYEELEIREILWLMREGGIKEVRSGLPLHTLLSPVETPDIILVCCFDSDPYVSSPQVSCVGNAEKILKGLDIAQRALGIKKSAIGVLESEKKIFSNLKLLLRYNTDILLYLLKDRYPQSDDDVLLKTLTGKNPDEINAVILSAETLINTANVFETGIPVTNKIVTVSGDDILEPVNYRAPIGITFGALVSDSGYTSPKIVIRDGIVDGEIVKDMSVPVTGTTKALIAFNDPNNIPKYREELI